MKHLVLALVTLASLAACDGPAEKDGKDRDKAATAANGLPYEGNGPNEKLGEAQDRATSAATRARDAEAAELKQQSAAVTYNAATGTTSTGASATSTTAAATTANTSGQLSATVAAQVTQALAPAQAGITLLNSQLTSGQTKLSALGQVQSAIADFQTLAKSMTTTTDTTTGTGVPSASDTTAKVNSFVSAYNALATKLQTLSAGDLKSDPGLAQVSAQLTQAMRDAGGTSSSGALAKAGISLSSSTGQLTVDSTKLSAALAANPSSVASLLGGDGSGKGIIDAVSTKLTMVSSAGGVIGRETTSATKDLSATDAKRTALTKALTTQATALAAMYTQQEQADSSTTNATTSLFDMLG